MTTRTVSAGHGWKWIVQGANVGRANPRAVYGATGIVALLALLPNVLQALVQVGFALDARAQVMLVGATSLLAMLIYPVLIGGVLRVIEAVESGRPARASDVFATFSNGQTGRLIGFGALMGGLYIATFYVLISLFGEGVPEWYMEILEISQALGEQAVPATPPELPLPPAGIGPLIALAIFFGVYFTTVYAIALGQVALGERTVMQALVDGLGGALKNVLPVVVGAACATAACLAMTLAFLMVAGVLGAIAGLLHPLLAMLVVMPLYLVFLMVLYIVMFGAMYTMWRDLCAAPETGVPPRAPEPGAGNGRIEL